MSSWSSSSLQCLLVLTKFVQFISACVWEPLLHLRLDYLLSKNYCLHNILVIYSGIICL